MKLLDGHVMMGEDISIPLQDLEMFGEGMLVARVGDNFIPEEDCTVEEKEVFNAWREIYPNGKPIEQPLGQLKKDFQVRLAAARDKHLTRFNSKALGEMHIYKKEGQSDQELWDTVKELLPLYPDEATQNWYVVAKVEPDESITPLAKYLPHTKPQMQQVFNDYLMHYIDTWEAYESLSSAADDVQTIEELEAIQIPWN